MATDVSEASTSLEDLGESLNCLPLSSPALNDMVDFMLSGFLTGCQPVRYGCDLREYLYNFNTGNDSEIPTTVHYTGSRAEGIDQAADDDLMFVNHNFCVVNQSANIVNKHENVLFFTAVDTAHPGYVLIQRVVHRDSFKNESGRDDLKLNENDGFLRNDVIKAFMLKSDPEESDSDDFFNELSEHGPALTDDKLDFVCAVPCYEWPDIASEFTTRPRKFSQPSQETIMRIVSQGCLYVGVGHPISNDLGKEWRISFSLAEKILVRCWSNVKLKCYIAVKALCKEHLITEPKVICSYFIKTAIFWLTERMPQSFWEEGRILECIEAVLKELLTYTSSEICPNYFVPSNNMMDHLNHDKRQETVSIIESILSDLPLAILQSELAAFTFKSSGDLVTLYQILKNSDSPSNAETQLAQVNAHNRQSHFKNNDKYYESMHFTEISQELKQFFHRRLTDEVKLAGEMILKDLSKIIPNQSFRNPYEQLVFLALGDKYHEMASKCDASMQEQLLVQAEGWISKAGVLQHPSGFADAGILTSATKSLLYYTTGDKDRAFKLCSQECDVLYSNLSNLHSLCQWSCAVVITTHQAEHFSSIDSNFVAILDEGDLLVSPMSIILYIAIKCCRTDEQCSRFIRCFEDLLQWFPPQITYYEKELHKNHNLLQNILTQDGFCKSKHDQAA